MVMTSSSDNMSNYSRIAIGSSYILEDRCIDDVMDNLFVSLLYKTSSFDVAVRLFSYRSQMTSKHSKSISDTLA